MIQKQNASGVKFLLTVFFATVMSVVFILLGTPALRVLRGVFGSLKYWLSGLLVCSTMWFLGTDLLPGLHVFTLLLVSIWVLIGTYSELEEKGKANLLTMSASIAAGTAVFFVGVTQLAKQAGVTLKELVSTALKSFLQQMVSSQGNSSMKIDVEAIASQAPSAVIILMMLSLGFALMLDSRTARWLGLSYEKVASSMKLLSFKAPDIFIWLTMLAFLFSFLKLEPPVVGIVAANVFNVLLALYFFQGLAVLEASFVAFSIGYFMKFLIYFLIVGQLFFLLSLVGIIDFWVDFRRRMKRLRNSESNQNGEHI